MIFNIEKAENYLEEKLNTADNNENLEKDIEKADETAELVQVYYIFPKQMEIKKTENLNALIQENNQNNLVSEAIIEFIIRIYGYSNWMHENSAESLQNTINQINDESNNKNLVGLVKEFLIYQDF